MSLRVIKVIGFANGANEAEMELGLFRHVPDDPGDLEELFVIILLQRATFHVGAVEKAVGGSYIDHDRLRVVQGRYWGRRRSWAALKTLKIVESAKVK